MVTSSRVTKGVGSFWDN